MGGSDLQHPTVDPAELADQVGTGQQLNPEGESEVQQHEKRNYWSIPPLENITGAGGLETEKIVRESRKVVETVYEAPEFQLFHTF